MIPIEVHGHKWGKKERRCKPRQNWEKNSQEIEYSPFGLYEKNLKNRYWILWSINSYFRI